MESLKKADLFLILEDYKKLCEKHKHKPISEYEKVMESFPPAEQISLRKENSICADCDAPDPKWCSTNLGVFICIKCSGIHRSLGTHVSKILSVSIDDWDKVLLDFVSRKGNFNVNKEMEYKIPSNYVKPTQDSSMEERKKYIYSKYVRNRFTEGYVDDNSDDLYDKNSRAMARSKSVKSQKALQEYVGIVIVKLISGSNLMACDMNGKSDPFVIFNIGSQTAKSRTISCTLNPVWNETFQFCVESVSQRLDMKVFDYDFAKKNDPMGNASIALEDLVDGKSTVKTITLENATSGVVNLELTLNILN